jgi:hypothetical protein
VEFDNSFDNFSMVTDSFDNKEISIDGSDFDSRIDDDNSEEGIVTMTESMLVDNLSGFSKNISATDT